MPFTKLENVVENTAEIGIELCKKWFEKKFKDSDDVLRLIYSNSDLSEMDKLYTAMKFGQFAQTLTMVKTTLERDVTWDEIQTILASFI